MRVRIKNTGLLGGCFSGVFGISFLIFSLMIGPWALQYDLNSWLPILHKTFSAIHDVTPVHMSFLLFIAGLFLFEVAVPLAIITWLLFGLGIL